MIKIRVIFHFLVVFFISACIGGSNTGPVYEPPPLDIGPVSIELEIAPDGELALVGEFSYPLYAVENLGGVYWNIGFERILREAQRQSRHLYLMWEDDQDNIVVHEYDIGQPFDIQFRRTEWVRKLAHSGDENLVVFIERQVIYADTYGSDSSSCPGAPPQRVEVGMQAYVCTQSDRVRVREDAGVSGSEITRLEPGTSFTIVKGPKCSDNWSWWRIRTGNGVVGWVAEGGDDIDSYFICPSR